MSAFVDSIFKPDLHEAPQKRQKRNRGDILIQVAVGNVFNGSSFFIQDTNRIREVLYHRAEEDIMNEDALGEVDTQHVEEGDLFACGKVSHDPLRIRGGGEEGNSESDGESTKEPPEKKSCPNKSLFLDADVTDELLYSPPTTKTRGVKRRSNSCDGRVEGGKETETGSIFFHSTPVRPGAGGLGVSFKDDMDLIQDKIVDLLKRKTKKTQQVDKRWTRYPAKLRQPPKQDLEEESEPHKQTLEDGAEGNTGGVRHDDVSGRGDNVSVHTVGFFDDIREDEDPLKDLRDEGHDEDIREMETDGGEEDTAGKVTENAERETLVGETIEEMQERHDGPKERQTQGDENYSGRFVEADDNVNVEEEQQIDENDEEEKRDPFEFDDSFNDPPYVPPKRRAPLPSSATKRPRLTYPRKQPASSGSTSPEHVKTRTEPVDVEQKRQKIDPKVLEFLVHRFAKAKRKDLATEVLPLSFFNELVRAYGAVPGGGRLAPYTSGTDTTRTFRDVGTDFSSCMRYVRCVHSMSCLELMI